jgi:hypothetical protein
MVFYVLMGLAIIGAIVVPLFMRNGNDKQVAAEQEPEVWLPVRTIRTCCGTASDQRHAPGCTWAPPPPSPAEWSNRR